MCWTSGDCLVRIRGDVYASCWNVVYYLSFSGNKTKTRTNEVDPKHECTISRQPLKSKHFSLGTKACKMNLVSSSV